MKKFNIFEFLATDLYAGLIPYKITGKYKGGGTIGTIIGFILSFILPLNNIFYSIFLSIFILFSIFISHYASKNYGTGDDQRIIIDETAGYFTTIAFLPRETNILIFSFIVFRVFDGLKPLPIKWLDKKIKGGLGIVLDDIIAGVFSNIVVRIFMY